MPDAAKSWIKERRDIHSAATDGPWAIWEDLKDGGFVHVGDEAGVIPEGAMATSEDGPFNPTAKCYVRPDATAIVDAHNVTVPTALSMVEAVLELHRPEAFEDAYSMQSGFMCESCYDPDKNEWIEYPCPTVRAIEGAINE